MDEETVRLRSHIKATKDALEAGGSIGRKLDFIAQEMNREANTILSKANDLEISDTGINLKTDIEKSGNRSRISNRNERFYGKVNEYRIWQYGQHR